MRKVLLSIVVFLVIGTLGAQTVTLTFTGRDAANHYVQLNKVVISNLTKSWQETIWWPDTVLQMLNGTGIDDHITNGGFALSQNNPNPFSGTTDVTLTVVEDGDVDLDIADVNGRIVETQKFASLYPGTHQFRISLSSVGTYVMTARQNGKTSSIKMICYGGGGSNTIDYLGIVQAITVVLKSSTYKPFNFGDMMEYVGYATIDGSGVESQHISQVQNTSQTFVLEFAVSSYQPPIVTTHAVTNITDNSATSGGTINSDGGTTITARGVCWSATPNPTLSGMHTTDGSGAGSFTSNLTGLTPNITYYVRSYATNSAGTGYGQQETFNTNASLPTVTTSTPTNITTTSATLAGNVTSDGGSTVTERGVHVYWYLNGNHNIDIPCGSGTGNFTYNFTNLTPGVTYYVTAYAINSAGTAYGQTLSFTTLANLPEVSTHTVTNITATTATCGGNVISDGGGIVTARGVCWSTSQNPTTSGSHTSDGSGTGSFTSSITGLTAGTTYYVRAYATNSAGTAYGQQKSFTTAAIPTVSTSSITNISFSSATCGGTVSATGGSVIYSCGVCWSTSQNPTVNDNHTSDFGSFPGSFTSNITGLTPGNTYYVRAYATNTAGTGYGQEISFTTTSGVPSVSTAYVSNITTTSATCGGNVSNIGSSYVTARGVCWSTSPYPTINDNHTNDGSGTGNFISNITNLSANNTYYVRAYATNSAGTSYGTQRDFSTTPQQPEVGFYFISQGFAVTATTASCRIYLNNIWEVPIISKGVCWSTSQNPTINDAHTTDDIPYFEYIEGSLTYFLSTIAGLNPTTTYYARPYVTTSLGITYGGQASFTTDSLYGQPCPGIPTFTDYDGNTYNTVQIGDQCWMKENLRTRHYADGTSIFDAVTDRPQNSLLWSDTIPYCYYHWGDFSSIFRHGYTYNRKAVMRNASYSCSDNPSCFQGICPTGWHLPSDAEWIQLENYLETNNQYWCNNNYQNIAKALASKTGWESAPFPCQVGFNPSTNNSSGFSALSTGCSSNDPTTFTAGAFFWITSNKYYNLDYHSIQLENSSNTMADFSVTGNYSVRCVLGDAQNSIVTNTVSIISQTKASCSSKITSDGSFNIAARGVCWSTSHNPTINNNHTTDGYGVGAFISNISGLVAGTTYYVRAYYTTNNNNTTYGNEMTFETPSSTISQPCPNAVTVTDVDNNTYPTVQLGTQCWMAENLRTTRYANGTNIAYSEGSSSTTEAYRYFPYGASINLYPGGFLYNWSAVMGGSATSNTNPSGVQGICPDGWHVPSVAEWTQLFNYVASQSEYALATSWSWEYHIADALADEAGWKNSNGFGTPGNHCDTIFHTGFSAIPAETGAFNYSGGQYASFWSSTEGTSSSSVTYYQLQYNYSRIFENTSGKGSYMSVRCVKNASSSSSSMGVTTAPVTDITNNSATCGGQVYAPNISNVTARGVCWSISPHPTISDNHTTDGSGTGVFTSTLTDIYANRIYYIRAYVTSSTGTVYGNERIFYKTDINYDAQPCLGTANADNTYNTVQIGTQCWLKENVRNTNYANGTPISLGSILSDTTAYYYYPGENLYNKDTYGLLYNWTAAVGDDTMNLASDMLVQGICPTGWHLPRDYEWTDLVQYIKGQSEYLCGNSSYTKALASTTGWNNSTAGCDPGNNPASNNATGFSAFPAGNREYSSYMGSFARFWSCSPSTLNTSSNTFTLSQISYSQKNYGLSVRCLRNAPNSENETEMTISAATYAPSSTTTSSAILNGTVFNPKNVAVSAQGFQWKAASASTYTSVNVSGNSLTYSLTGLTPDNNYTYRTFVTTAQGTLYGPYVSFTTMPVPGAPCPNTPTVNDFDGNVYNTVKIGDQCWLKENLRTTHYANGDEIPIGSTTSNTIAYRYNPNNNASNVATYGYLYNWPAVMRGESGSDVNPSGVQGICPIGWHVPSSAEWTQLTNYVKSIPDYVCGDNNNYIAKVLAATTGWTSNSTACAVGNDQSANNATGFGALSAGKYGAPYYFGTSAYYWSTTGINSYASCYCLSYSNAQISLNSGVNTAFGYSVRCIRDACCSEQPITVTTGAATSINHMSAILNGAVINPENATITALGFQWKTASGGIYTTNYTQDTSFSYSLTHLQSENSYQYRAFINTEQGCSVYGPEVSFTTLPTPTCPNTPTVTDYDGNTYNTVLIGNQCWMKENLRTMHYSDGVEIPAGSSSSNDSAYRYAPDNNESNVTTYGYLYNWPAVMHGAASSFANPSGVQGICPSGWHVPSDAEWDQLIDYVSAPEYLCGGYTNSTAKALASTTGWISSTSTCAVGNDLSVNNLTGFNAMPASIYNGFYNTLGNSAAFWSSRQRIFYSLAYYSYNFAQINNGLGCGCSVRCIRNENSIPTVITNEVSVVTSTSASCGGNVASDGGTTVTARGVCWSTSQNPTINDSHTTDGSGTGSFTSSITGISADSIYFVRAYATNSMGTAYGEQRGFTTNTQDGQPCPSVATVTDYDGNSYNTVQIGSQCWMKENLRTKHYSNGVSIPYSGSSSTNPNYYNCSSSGIALAQRGYLYNWSAVMNGASSSSSNPSGVQGICPTGWHVPSDAEWTQLTDYVSSLSGYVCGTDNTYIAKALSSTTEWSTSTNTCAVGNNQSANNATGFGAVPAGEFYSYNSSCRYDGTDAHFWSATEYSTDNAWYRVLSYIYPRVDRYNQGKSNGFSVRCLKD